MLIHLEANSLSQIQGHNPVIEWTRKTHPTVTTFDFNTLAQSSITKYALDLIRQADQIMMIVEVKIEKNLQLIREFLEAAAGLKGKAIKLVINGKQAKNVTSDIEVEPPILDVPTQGQKKLIREYFSKKA